MLATATMLAWGCKDKTETAPPAAEAGSGPTASSSPSASSSAAPPPLLTSLNGFEGEIDLIAQSGDPGRPTQSVNMLVHNDRIRLDTLPGTDTTRMLGGKAFLLVRVGDKKLDMVADQKKQVVEIDLSNPDAMKSLAKGAPGANPNAPAEPPPKLTKTGTKETIAGYSCEIWEVTSSKDHHKEASFCVADLPSTVFHVSIAGLPPEYAFTQELTDGQHFPLRITSYDERNGAESGRLEVKRFNPHPVDASKFEIPAGYTVIDVAQMMGNLGAASRAPGIPSGLNIPGISNLPHHTHPHH
jgi:hypothetical protein